MKLIKYKKKLIFLAVALSCGLAATIIYLNVAISQNPDAPLASAGKETHNTPAPVKSKLAAKEGPIHPIQKKEDENTSTSGEASAMWVSPPQEILDFLGITEEELAEKRKLFRNGGVHAEFLARLEGKADWTPDCILGAGAEIKQALATNQLTNLVLNSELEQYYYEGRINFQDFATHYRDLAYWFVESYLPMFSPDEIAQIYNLSVENPGAEDLHAMIDGLYDGMNQYFDPRVNAERILKTWPQYKIDLQQQYYRAYQFEEKLDQIALLEGRITQEERETRAVDSKRNYIETCKEILNDREFQELFHASKDDDSLNLDPPDEEALARENERLEFSHFQIENENTWVEEIYNKFSQEKIEEIAFYSRNRLEESNLLSQKFKSGDINLAEIQEGEAELHRLYIDNCKNALTDEQFFLVFGYDKNANPQESQEGFQFSETTQEKVPEDRFEKLISYQLAYQQELTDIQQQVDKGKISPEEANSRYFNSRLDFLTQCRTLLNEEEYQLVYEDFLHNQ